MIKEIKKKIKKVKGEKVMGTIKKMLLGLGLISATGIATMVILTPKSQKIIASRITKDTKSTIDNIADKSDEVKTIIVQGYKNINRDLRKLTKKISNELV